MALGLGCLPDYLGGHGKRHILTKTPQRDAARRSGSQVEKSRRPDVLTERIFLFATLEGLCPSFEYCADQLADPWRFFGALLKGASTIHNLRIARPVKSSNQNLLGVGVHNEIRIVGNEDYLPTAFSAANKLDQIRVDGQIVEIVFWLVND
jgi:hypothetical protein